MGEKSFKMYEGPIFSSLIKYTVPIAFSGILQLLFNAADMAVIGQFKGSKSVAAVGSTAALIGLLVSLFMSLSVGGGVCIGQMAGDRFLCRDKEKIQRILHTVMASAFICGILLTALGIAASYPFLKIMGTPDDIIKSAAVYLKIYFLGSLPLAVFNFGTAVLMALGDSKKPLLYLSAAGIINVVLNIFFVSVLNMDTDGVALATVISQTVSAILVLKSLLLRKDYFNLDFKKIRIYREELLKIFKIGFPAGIQSLAFSVSNIIIMSSINSFGAAAVSGHSAAYNIDNFVYIIMNAFYQSTMNFTAQNYGAKRFDRIKKITVISLLSVSAIGLLLSAAVFIFAEPLLSIYITDSEEAMEYGIIRITYMCLPYFICGCMEVVSGIIRGMGNSFAPMAVSITGVCGIRLLWIFTAFRIPAYHSMKSLYISYPISWLITFLTNLLILIYIFKKQKLKMQTSE